MFQVPLLFGYKIIMPLRNVEAKENPRKQFRNSKQSNLANICVEFVLNSETKK